MSRKKTAAVPDPTLIPAVIYARYSSSGQREESIEGQLRECKAWAARNGFRIIGEYTDKALTGRTDKRPDFQRMLKDSERGVFKAVICWKIDRFARNRYDSATYKYKLKKNGVRVYYAKEAIPEGPEGIILESVMEGYAEYYSENLSQNIKRGNYDSALEMKTLGYKVLGLRKGPDGRFEIDPATAPIVLRIFEEYAAGESAKDIYTRLNEEGYRTSRGGLFNKNSLRHILKNEKYVGVYAYKDIRDEHGIPPIVSRELFDKCQSMLATHHHSPAAARDVSFLLTSKLFCGHCGEPMTGDGGTSKTGRVYHYYTCNNRKRKKCKKERAPKDWIEQLVIDELVKLIHSDDFINEVADRCMEYQKREKDQSALHALEARQKENAKAIQNMLAAIEAGIITPSTKSRLVELEAEKAQIETGIAQQLIDEPDLERDQIVYFLERFRGGDVDDESYQQLLVGVFLNAVYLYDDKFTLVLNYSGENSKVTLELVENATNCADPECSAFARSAPPKRYYTNLFISTAALPLQYGSSNIKIKADVLGYESIRFIYPLCVRFVRGQSADNLQRILAFSYCSVRFFCFSEDYYRCLKFPHKRFSFCYTILAGGSQTIIYQEENTMNSQDLFLRIRALTHALDTMISSNGDAASEDVSILCWMLKDAVDEYDKKRTEV